MSFSFYLPLSIFSFFPLFFLFFSPLSCFSFFFSLFSLFFLSILSFPFCSLSFLFFFFLSFVCFVCLADLSVSISVRSPYRLISSLIQPAYPFASCLDLDIAIPEGANMRACLHRSRLLLTMQWWPSSWSVWLSIDCCVGLLYSFRIRMGSGPN